MAIKALSEKEVNGMSTGNSLKTFCRKWLYAFWNRYVVAYFVRSDDIFKGNNGLAVILVDMQQYFINDLKCHEEQRVIPNQIAVIKQCAKNNIPVIVLEYCNCGKTIPVLAAELKKLKNPRFIRKSEDNGFDGTRLNRVLKKIKAKRLFFMGINAGACVKETVQNALELSFEVIISNDVITSPGDKNCIPWYEENGIVVRVTGLRHTLS